jgi:hypothetical protein
MKKVSIILLIIFSMIFILRNQKKDQTAKSDRSIKVANETKPIEQQTTQTTDLETRPKASVSEQRSAPAGRVEIHDPDLLSLDENQSLLVSSFMVIDDYAISFGDILIAPLEEILEYERTNQQPKMPKPRIWPQGLVPYMIEPEVEQEHLIKNVIRYFHQHTPIRFIERTDQEDYVAFLKGSEHCFAHLGRIGGRQKVVLSELCSEIEIAHELMHTLGFIHEQNRVDRDEHIQIFWNNIDSNFHEQFKKIPSQFSINQNDNHHLMQFSFETTMIYNPFAFALEPHRPAMLKIDGEQWPRLPSILGSRDLERLQLVYGTP